MIWFGGHLLDLRTNLALPLWISVLVPQKWPGTFSLTLSAQAQSQPSPAAGPTLRGCPEVKGQMISHVTGAVEGKMKHKEQGMER